MESIPFRFDAALSPDNVDQYECPISEEELLRSAQQRGGRPLADILNDLERLTEPEV